MTSREGTTSGLVIVAGAGIRVPGHLTLETFEALSLSDDIFTILTPALATLLPRELEPKVHSLWSHYRAGIRRRDAYASEVEAILSAAELGRTVAYLTVGNPVFFDSVTQGLLEDGPRRGVRVEVLSGVSAVDSILTDLRLDIAPGCQVYDASSIVAYRVQLRNDMSCLLLQPDLFGTSYVAIGHEPKPHTMQALKDYLLQFYPPDHTLTYVTSAVADHQRARLVTFALRDLGGTEETPQTPGASLFIPAAVEPTPDREFVARMADAASFTESYRRTRIPIPASAPSPTVVASVTYDAVVLLSGGLDSAVLLRDVIESGKSDVIALHLSGVGSRHETLAARRIAADASVDLHIMEMASFFEACQILEQDEVDRQGRRVVLGAATIYLAALAFALARRIPLVVIGLHDGDSMEWVEQTPKFLDLVRQGVRMVGSDCLLTAPFHSWSKSQVLMRGAELGIDFSQTWSCVSPAGTHHDGVCRACRDRRAAFEVAGVPDNTVYASPAPNGAQGES